MDRRSYPMLSIPVLLTADQYWRHEPAALPVLTAELTPLVAAESLTPLAEAESLAPLVAGDQRVESIVVEPILVEPVLAEPALAEPMLAQPAIFGAPVKDQRRRRLRLPIRRVQR